MYKLQHMNNRRYQKLSSFEQNLGNPVAMTENCAEDL